MGVSILRLRLFLGWTLLIAVPVSLLGQAQTTPAVTGQTGQTAAAVLHAQGGVWINGYEAQDASAVFVGDLIETKTGFSANLSLDGSTVVLQPDSVAKLQDGELVLDHGGVFVGTSTSFKVRVKCITVVPVHNDLTQYDVTDVNGTVQVAAHKDDVRVELGLNREKATPQPETSYGAVVHEGEQGKYVEVEACGAPPRPAGAASTLNPKWIAAGVAGGGGVLLCILLCGGGGKSPVSPAKP